MTKIILVDDHKVFLQGLEALLMRAPELEVMATFTDGLELMRYLAEGNLPDVLMLDIEMESIGGVELAENVLKHYPRIKVIMLSTFFNEEYINDLMESGISGYLLKNTGFSDLKAGITKVSDGGFTFSPEVMEIIVNRFNVKPEAKRSGQSAGGALLSAREIELIKLIGEELTMREIAQKLFISEHTVKTHRKNIMAKMEVKNTAGLMKKAFILGLIQ